MSTLNNNVEDNNKIYKSISISDKNKGDLEDVMRNLEQYHKKNFRIDVALGHILQVYKRIKEPKKFYNLIEL